MFQLGTQSALMMTRASSRNVGKRVPFQEEPFIFSSASTTEKQVT